MKHKVLPSQNTKIMLKHIIPLACGSLAMLASNALAAGPTPAPSPGGGGGVPVVPEMNPLILLAPLALVIMLVSAWKFFRKPAGNNEAS